MCQIQSITVWYLIVWYESVYVHVVDTCTDKTKESILEKASFFIENPDTQNITIKVIIIFTTFVHLDLHCLLWLSSLHLWEWSCRHRIVILSTALEETFQFEGRLFCYPHAWFCSIHSCSTLVSVLQHQFELILGHHLCENLFPSLLGPVSMNNLYFDWYQTINGLSRSGIIEYCQALGSGPSPISNSKRSKVQIKLSL